MEKMNILKYERASIEIVNFGTQDIIAVSGDVLGDNGFAGEGLTINRIWTVNDEE